MSVNDPIGDMLTRIRNACMARHTTVNIPSSKMKLSIAEILKREGFNVIEVATDWTDKIGSKVTQSLLRSSLVMFLSVVRLRLVYSPFYRWLKPLRPLETWVYMKLRAPAPRSRGCWPSRSSSTSSFIPCG